MDKELNKKFQKAVKHAWHWYIYQYIKEGADIHSISQEQLDDLLCRACANADGGGAVEAHQLTPKQYYGLIKMYREAGASVNLTPHTSDSRHISPLQWAIQTGNDDVVFYLLDEGADILHRDKQGGSPLLSALLTDKYRYVPYLLADREGITDPRIMRKLGLHLSVGKLELLPSLLDTLNILVSLGVNIDTPLERGETLLTIAAQKSNNIRREAPSPCRIVLRSNTPEEDNDYAEELLKITKFLLENGADPNHFDDLRHSAFDYAELLNPKLFSLLETFATRKPRPPSKEEIEREKKKAFEENLPSLMNPQYIASLLEDDDLYTLGMVLIEAVKINRVDCFKSSLDAGLPIDTFFEYERDTWGNVKTAPLIYLAAQHNNMEALKFLVGRGANPYLCAEKETFQNNALAQALEHKNKELALYLINLSPQPFIDWQMEGREFLHYALWDLELTQCLVACGVDIEEEWGREYSPLHGALYYPETLEYLLSIGADSESQDDCDLLTPFERAMKQGNLRAMEILYKYKPKIDDRTIRAFYSHPQEKEDCLKTIQKLDELGVDLKQYEDLFMLQAIIGDFSSCRDYLFSRFGTDAPTWHILCWCALNNLEKISVLFKPECPQNGDLLHIAVIRNYTDMVELLLKKGVSPNDSGIATEADEEEIFRKSHLELAVSQKNLKAVQLLLDYGADLVVNPYSILFQACKHQNWEIFKTLIDRGISLESDPSNLHFYHNYIYLYYVKDSFGPIKDYLMDYYSRKYKKPVPKELS